MRSSILVFCLALIAVAPLAGANDASFQHSPLTVGDNDMIPTGNEWIAFPMIHAADGAIENFNVLSMRDRGLLEVEGDRGGPALDPYFVVNNRRLPFQHPSWEVTEYWIPTARVMADGMEATITYCLPPNSHAALLRMTLTNHRAQAATIGLGMQASWGSLDRVTYKPVQLHGERTLAPMTWVEDSNVFAFVTSDTQFAWSLLSPGAHTKLLLPPVVTAPFLDARKTVTVKPGETVEMCYILAVGIEEFSAGDSGRVLQEQIDRYGADGIIARTAAWCRQRAHTTGQADLDLLMNRNFLFTELYAWGRALDTGQVVGMTSRSPRYYVSAAYWDRDAMLWSLPALLDIDPPMAREALDYALTVQLRETGTHSRFITGIVLEGGFQLDEAVAPIIGLGNYVRRTNDNAFLTEHRRAIDTLRDRLLGRFDPQTGLYSSLQDSQDNYEKLPFQTYDNVLTWRALNELAAIYGRLQDEPTAKEMAQRATALQRAVMHYCVATPPGAHEPIFANATDGKTYLFTEVPPGSLMKLPLLGFIPENDPLFTRTYDWLHSPSYAYSYSDQTYGLPGSQRLPFTTSWSVADHLRLSRSREQALKILRASNWDAGIITEGIDPRTGSMDYAGRAFATAAGYVADAIWQTFGQKSSP